MEKRVDAGGQGAVVFDDVLTEETGVPGSFHIVIVDMLDLPGMRDELRRPMMLLVSASKPHPNT